MEAYYFILIKQIFFLQNTKLLKNIYKIIELHHRFLTKININHFPPTALLNQQQQ